MHALRVRNLRSLVDTDFVDLKPLTLLVGQNGSGKSSFLRVFPLLRQSVEVRTKGPILWYGSYVDYGSFEETRHVHSENDSISFDFRFLIGPHDERPHLPFSKRVLISEHDIRATIDLVYDKRSDSTLTRRCSLQFADFNVDIIIEGSVTSFKVNGFDVLAEGSSYSAFQGRQLFPQILPRTEDAPEAFRLVARRGVDPHLMKHLLSLLSPYFHGRTTRHRRLAVLMELQVGDRDQMMANIIGAYPKSETWQQRIPRMINTSRFDTIRNIIAALSVPDILSSLNSRAFDYFSSVSYTSPQRAAAERYYRRQDLAIDEVDPQGSNVAMFLRSMSDRDRRLFQEWTIEHFGFSVRTRTQGGHISILLDDGGASFNIADMGFGFSQLLPVIIQIWSRLHSRRHRGRRSSQVIFTIEQPELHLHPAMQARFADLVADILRLSHKSQLRPFFIIETHSSAIINRIGERISGGTGVHEEDVQVLIFEPRESHTSTVLRSTYDSQGFLQQWPYGFFEPDPIA